MGAPKKPPALDDSPDEICRDDRCTILAVHAVHPIATRRGPKIRIPKLKLQES